MDYIDFLRTKIEVAPISGFEVEDEELAPVLKPHQRTAVRWALHGGRRALFESFGLGKTLQELEFCRQVIRHEGGRALIVCPLGVRQEFHHDAVELLGMEAPRYITRMDELNEAGIYITNYERVRDGDIEPRAFSACVLDEAAVLRSFGSKTYQTFLPKFKGVKYKLVATATPAPNRLKELIHYAGFLEVMDTGQALTRFFQRDSSKANNLTLYPHKVDEFWLWVSTWALYISKPSDLGFEDEGYALPPLKIRPHMLSEKYGDHLEKDGQYKLMNDAAASLQQASKEKKDSIKIRCEEAKRIVEAEPGTHFILWHDREDERHEIKKLLPETTDIYGSMDYDEREKRVIDFSFGRTRLFATKKSLSGCGCNFQRFCHRAIFVGIDYEFHDFIQAVHRIYRFLQNEEVIIDIIFTEAEQPIYQALMAKWKQHDEQQEAMREIIKKYGLNNETQISQMARSIGVDKVVITGKRYTAIHGDCVEETAKMDENSVDMVLTSIPFSNHYEYTPSYNDFGHNEDTEKFFEQMDYLSPNLLKVLKPGRVFACHVKDRVLFGNSTGTGMPTMEPFHALCIEHYMGHGFQYFGMITVVTDVVRENNQTYRLGWTEQCKDGTKMGVGCPEYILLFRKLPTDTSTAYADVPVTKSKYEYTRAQWQIDAHGFWRSSGDRLLTKAEIMSMPVDKLQAAYRKFSRGTVYSYDEHIALSKKLDEDGHLPATFMVVAPGSWSEDVWDDINRMKTLNTTQSQRRKQLHVCLASGSLILTRRGFKPIENVEIGDVVLTHNGNWKPIVAKARTGVKDTVQTKAQGVANLITTPDHRLWCRKPKKARPMDYLSKTEPAWVEAKDTVNGFVNLKLPATEESNLSEKEWWLVGRYLADGHMGTRGDYFISVGEDKVAEFEEKASGFYGSCAERTAIQYRLLSNNLSDELRQTLNECGRGAENKQVPISGLCLNESKSAALIEGYLSGDGNVTGNMTSASSVSRALLLGMAMVAQKAYGVVPSVLASKKPGKHKIGDREIEQKQLWVMSWRKGKHDCSRIFDDGAWKRVKKSVPTGEKEVWSIEVADDHSFTAEGCIVKNCPLQTDIVDRLINRYSNEGDLIYDPFGGIGTVPFRALKSGRKGLMCELNEGYFRDAVGYLEAEEAKVDTPTLFDMMENIS